MSTEFKLIKKDYNQGWRDANQGREYCDREATCVHSYRKGFKEMSRP